VTVTKTNLVREKLRAGIAERVDDRPGGAVGIAAA
jgi:hypothetical protein